MKHRALSAALLAASLLMALKADEILRAAEPATLTSPEPDLNQVEAASETGFVIDPSPYITVLPYNSRALRSAPYRSTDPFGAAPFPRLLFTLEEPLQGCQPEPGPLDAWYAGLEYDPLLNDDVLAYYGKPGVSTMGILGRLSKEENDKRLEALAAQYDAANGQRGVKRAFYLIYGTVWPEGEIGILKEATTREWVEYALRRGMIVFLDHQIGKYTVEEAMARLLPWLAYPNVHLALDPEWRTTKPMKEIGSVKADELNAAQAQMQAYIEERGLPGRRMLVVHQFKPYMIREAETLRADFDRVHLVHCADGFGNPAVKLEAYQRNAAKTNLPLKGYKLFYESGYPGAGFDKPLMSPAQVMALSPAPALVMYQ